MNRDLIPYLRSAAVHPEGVTYMPNRAKLHNLREEAFKLGMLEPKGYGLVGITAIGRKEVDCYELPDIDVQRLMDDGCPHA